MGVNAVGCNVKLSLTEGLRDGRRVGLRDILFDGFLVGFRDGRRLGLFVTLNGIKTIMRLELHLKQGAIYSFSGLTA